MIKLTDSTGAAASYSYNPYGKTTASSGSMDSVNNYRYASGYTDGTGLINFGARYYNPTLARFTQPDSSRQETNNYTYTGDNPIIRTDSTGLNYELDDFSNTVSNYAGAGAGIGGAIGGVAGAISGGIAGAPARGVGAGPGAVAGADGGGISGGLIGGAVGAVFGVGACIVDWLSS